MTLSLPNIPPADPALPNSSRIAEMRQAASALEGAFLAEMLRHSGLATPLESFGGGPGEEAVSGMLVDAFAEKLAASGGIGLSESIFRALVERGAAP